MTSAFARRSKLAPKFCDWIAAGMTEQTEKTMRARRYRVMMLLDDVGHDEEKHVKPQTLRHQTSVPALLAVNNDHVGL